MRSILEGYEAKLEFKILVLRNFQPRIEAIKDQLSTKELELSGFIAGVLCPYGALI